MCLCYCDTYLKGWCGRVERNALVLSLFSALHQSSTCCMFEQQPSVGKVRVKQLMLQQASL